jgi:hypothetical protein
VVESIWERLTFEQLNGAQFSLKYLRTSPVIRGEALALLDSLIVDIWEEMGNKSEPPGSPSGAKPLDNIEVNK